MLYSHVYANIRTKYTVIQNKTAYTEGIFTNTIPKLQSIEVLHIYFYIYIIFFYAGDILKDSETYGPT